MKLTVSWSGFKPGCVRVSAQDAAGAGEARSIELTGKGGFTGGEATLAVYREEGWGTTLALTVEAFERACQGPAVVRSSRTVTVTPGEVSEVALSVEAQDVDQDGYVSQLTGGTDCLDAEPLVYPSAPELCDSRDNDCDTQVDEGLAVGASCDPGVLGCSGQRRCAPDGGTSCVLLADPTLYYPDGDQDTYGQADAGVSACGSPDAGFIMRGGDCDDRAPSVHPEATELCDALDNDCNGSVDESFTLNVACDPGLGCEGLVACAADGGTRCDFITPPQVYYPDEDRDTFGQVDAGVTTCSPSEGYISDNQDCNDGNLFTYPGARELCDGEDNDCNGAAEEASVCEGVEAGWVSQTIGDNSKSWYSVDVWGDGGVWVAGESSRRARKLPGEAFSSLSADCGGDWLSLWVDRRNGRAYLGGLSGKLGIHELGSDACTVLSAPDTDNTYGLWGFPLADGGVDIHGAGTKSSDGRLFRWDGDGGTQVLTSAVGVPFLGVHGASPEQLFAAGGPNGSARIYQFDAGTSAWNDLGVDTTNVEDLNAVWVVHPRLAFAVGDNRTVMKWDGSTWSRFPGPPTSIAGSWDDLGSIIAFGSASLYVVSLQGEIYRYDGTSWSKVFTSSLTLWDIAGTSPEDLWVVGSSGRILHWPR